MGKSHKSVGGRSSLRYKLSSSVKIVWDVEYQCLKPRGEFRLEMHMEGRLDPSLSASSPRRFHIIQPTPSATWCKNKLACSQLGLLTFLTHHTHPGLCLRTHLAHKSRGSSDGKNHLTKYYRDRCDIENVILMNYAALRKHIFYGFTFLLTCIFNSIM